MSKVYFVGVDVGTGSCRAALIDSTGHVHEVHVRETKTWNPLPDHYEQSSEDIWSGICECVQIVTRNYPKEKVSGIGFDATCSLVALDKNDKPLSVSTTGDNNQNIILWMDHRAEKEADQINATKHELLKCVGGKVSLEMEIPKVMWLKSNLNEKCWSKLGKLFDLPDFLTWKCTGDDTRSLCSIVCKWNYDGFNQTWSRDFFKTLGIEELCANDFAILGRNVTTPGATIGNGLNEAAARDLGLNVGTPVAGSMIDAHAGALCLLGCHADGIDEAISSKMALICGTSSCHMSVQKELIWPSGIWGPYIDAIFPGFYLHEGGQSATGILLDYIVKSHPSYKDAMENAGTLHVFEYLNQQLVRMAEAQKLSSVHYLTKDFHVWPDFHGNRSPLGDPTIKGMICGLTISSTVDNLALTYLGFVQALSYGTRHILDQLKDSGRKPFHSLLICGGLRKNQLFVETHAEACVMPVLIPDEGEMVLVGSAMLAACAAKVFPSLEVASKEMASRCEVVWPNPALRDYHERKYKIFRQMITDQMKYKEIMLL
ncbi:FGGY carbohydrate kinase domain-containing protein [Contarinia nasturtii]|uniref:FGGY carbohydrate kinase domain-containing protein n=1 Tax=Contarinia nasturtii TaxID=265458 RepID=UPI0012D46910|nr:FGGY carbohydrate kinase domain-containing protein [Contarinia nasturtii]